MKAKNYRPDIDGLRAIAVLSVVLFHIEPSYLSGGFLGVDIFFVISGFLITGIIYREKLDNTFSFANFYVRRAKRILPPLFLLLILVLVIGYFISLPYEYYKVGISTLSVLAFASNMQYALRTGDYFSNDSSEWPLLHTWSLAVEEQYYFTFPITLFLLIKFFDNRKFIILFALCIASFILAEYMSRTPSLQSVSYYLLFTRFGEMLVGSLLALLSVSGKLPRFRSNGLALAALLVVAALMAFINESFPFPGFVALAICLPIAVLINSENTIANKILANRVFVFIGLISYSLYLFHWPILAYIRYVFDIKGEGYSLPFNLQIMAVAAMAILSLGSFFLIERPLRRFKLKPIYVGAFYFLIPTLLLGSVAGYVVYNKGLPQRLSTSDVNADFQYSHIDKNKCPDLVNLGCEGGRTDSQKKIVFFGNSHAEHYFEYVSTLANKYDYDVKLYASGGCGMGGARDSQKCQVVREAFDKVSESADLIFIAFRWDKRRSGLADLVSSLVKQGKRVVVLAQPPLLTVNPAKISNCIRLGVHCDQDVSVSDQYPKYNELVKNIAVSNGAEFLDPYAYVPDFKTYRDGDILYYSDDDHLSVYGAKWLAQLYENAGASIFQ